MDLFYFYTALIGVAFASLFEWTLHRYFMHRPFLGFFKYPFRQHAMIHHHVFKADPSYDINNHEKEEQKKHLHTIPMAWWNGPVLVLVGTLLTIPFCLLFKNWWISPIICFQFALYYGTYERLHWCMHRPQQRRLEQGWIFRYLNGHHILHHRYMHKNFNVVLPLADLIFGTLCLRSPLRFAQVTGPSVPDLQPKPR